MIKRGFVIVLLLALLVMPCFAAAQAELVIPNDTAAARAAAESAAKTLNEQTENVLERTANIPSFLVAPASLFGIKGSVTWQDLIVTISVWLCVFIIVLSALAMLPFMNKGLVKLVGAVVITILVSITGALKEVVLWYTDLIGLIAFAKDLPTLQTILAIVIAVMVVFFISWLVGKGKEQEMVERAEMSGMKVGAMTQIESEKLKEE